MFPCGPGQATSPRQVRRASDCPCLFRCSVPWSAALPSRVSSRGHSAHPCVCVIVLLWSACPPPVPFLHSFPGPLGVFWACVCACMCVNACVYVFTRVCVGVYAHPAPGPRHPSRTCILHACLCACRGQLCWWPVHTQGHGLCLHVWLSSHSCSTVACPEPHSAVSPPPPCCCPLLGGSSWFLGAVGLPAAAGWRA